MGIYRYKAKSLEGKTVKGTLEVASQVEVIQELKEQNLYAYDITTVSDERKTDTMKKMKLKELVTFCKQLSATLSAWVMLVRALDVIYETTNKKYIKNIVTNLYDGVHKGQSLSVSMAELGKTFPPLLINMIETGESSGNLDVIMKKMSDHYENERRLNNKIVTALIYPAILSILSVLIIIFMVTWILPSFMSMFEGMDLPLPTKIIVSLSNFLINNWAGIIVFLLLFTVLLKYLLSLDVVKYNIDAIKIHLPIIGKLNRTIYTARFASTFGILYSSGIGMMQSLDITVNVINNLYIKKRLETVSDKIRNGEMLSTSLKEMNIFDGIFIAMVLTGEESGSLDSILEKTGIYFEEEAGNALTRLTSMIEPLMIIILAVVIALIVLAIILPIFEMYTNIL